MRLFVAVWPPPAVVARWAAFERPKLAGVRWTAEDQWHVTLRFLGEIDGEKIEGVKGALDPLRSDGQLRGLTARAGAVVTWPRSAVVCVLVDGLEALAAQVHRVTADFGAPADRRPFRAHVTLARTDGRDRHLGTGWPSFAASWPVEDVKLVASTLHPDGARYHVISRISLDGG